MRAFSQLLDDLVYTRSRNTKLKLTAIISGNAGSRPRSRWPHGRILNIPAVKAPRSVRSRGAGTGAVYMSRDYVGDMTSGVCCGPGGPKRAGRSRDATIGIRPGGRKRSAERKPARCAETLAAMSIISTPRVVELKTCDGAMRIGISADWPNGADVPRARVDAVEEGGTDCGPIRELFDGRRPRPRRRLRRAGVPAVLLASLEKPSLLQDFAAEGMDGPLQLVHAGGETRCCPRRRHFGKLPECRPFAKRAVLDARCWCAADRAPTAWRGAASFTPTQRLGARMSARAYRAKSGVRAPLRHLFDGDEISATCRGASGALGRSLRHPARSRALTCRS